VHGRINRSETGLEGFLILRDMGYFSVACFAAIAASGAYWLSRLPLNVGATDMEGKSLETRLRKHRGNHFEIRAKLTAGGYAARLVAIRASAKETEKRRREIKAEAKAKGRTASSRALLFAGWHILVTNIPEEMQSVESLAATYSHRWQIEIVFRGWKQASGLDKALGRKSSPQHLKGLVLASMIVLAMEVKIAIGLTRILGGRYSLEKICQYLNTSIPHRQAGRNQGTAGTIEPPARSAPHPDPETETQVIGYQIL
jgi:hypothetical protein